MNCIWLLFARRQRGILRKHVMCKHTMNFLYFESHSKTILTGKNWQPSSEMAGDAIPDCVPRGYHSSLLCKSVLVSFKTAITYFLVCSSSYSRFRHYSLTNKLNFYSSLLTSPSRFKMSKSSFSSPRLLFSTIIYIHIHGDNE